MVKCHSVSKVTFHLSIDRCAQNWFTDSNFCPLTAISVETNDLCIHSHINNKLTIIGLQVVVYYICPKPQYNYIYMLSLVVITSTLLSPPVFVCNYSPDDFLGLTTELTRASLLT